MSKCFSSQNVKPFNILIKGLHLAYPNHVLEPPISSPCLQQMWTNGSAETPRHHNTPDDIPVNQSPDTCWRAVVPVVLLPDILTLWSSPNLLANHKSHPQWFHSFVMRWNVAFLGYRGFPGTQSSLHFGASNSNGTLIEQVRKEQRKTQQKKEIKMPPA